MIAAAADPGRRGLAYGFDRAMDNTGAFLGPLVSALLLKFFFSGLRPVFALSAVPGLLAILALVLGAREPPGPAAPSGPGGQAREKLPRSLGFAVAIFAFFTLSNSTDAFLLLRARDCGVALWQVPLLWAVFNGAKALLNAPVGSLTDRIGRMPSILAGWGIYAAVYLGFARAGSRGTIWILFLVYSLFYALTEGAERALIADLAGPRVRGRAFGIFHMAVGIAALPASILFGVLWSRSGPRVAFEVDAVLALVSAAALGVFALVRKAPRS